MPWTEPAVNSNDLQRCMSDLVALSALPAAWQNYDMYQIGDSLVAALNWMVDADFVFIALLGHGNQLNRLASINPGLNSASLDRVQAMLQLQPQRKTATSDEQRKFIIPDASTGGNLHVVTTLIGFSGDAILAAGSVRNTFPTKTEKLLLDAGVNQASIAFRQWLGDADKRRFTTLVQRTNDFVGITSLGGRVQYVNPAGLQLVGLASLDDALRLDVSDFVLPEDRGAVRDEVWPQILRTGRWTGEAGSQAFWIWSTDTFPDRLLQDR
jgi:PAS domain-containing protein